MLRACLRDLHLERAIKLNRWNSGAILQALLSVNRNLQGMRKVKGLVTLSLWCEPRSRTYSVLHISHLCSSMDALCCCSLLV